MKNLTVKYKNIDCKKLIMIIMTTYNNDIFILEKSLRYLINPDTWYQSKLIVTEKRNVLVIFILNRFLNNLKINSNTFFF